MAKKTLVVVPTDPLESYERSGSIKKILQYNYFNPQKVFDDVVILSPIEPVGVRKVEDITVIGVRGTSAIESLCNIDPCIIRGYGGAKSCDFAVYTAALAIPRLPVYISVHDTNPNILFESVLFADKVHCTSRAVYNLVANIGVKNDRIEVVPNWVNQKIFFKTSEQPDMPEEWGDLSDRIPILHVGRKTTQKNLETTIAMLRFLPERYIAVFIGQGDDTQYKLLARKLNVTDRCFWKASVPNEKLRTWYSWCHVMCTPSRWEGFGIVFIEAAACGCPIVTSDIAPMNEFFENRHSAVLVKDYENPFALAEAVLRFEDKYFYENIAHGSLEMSKNFYIDTVQKIEANAMMTTRTHFKDHSMRMNLDAAAARYFHKFYA